MMLGDSIHFETVAGRTSAVVKPAKATGKGEVAKSKSSSSSQSSSSVSYKTEVVTTAATPMKVSNKKRKL